MTAAGFCPMAARTPAPRGETGSSGAPPDHPGGAPGFSLYPSGFTQLSNMRSSMRQTSAALYPSGFTQLSNCRLTGRPPPSGFVPLWIYTALKPHAGGGAGFLALYPSGFTQLSNSMWALESSLTLCTPLDLHSSQTIISISCRGLMLCTPLDLHSSQTRLVDRLLTRPLCTPLDLHSSQTHSLEVRRSDGFVPLWIYTALKLVVGDAVVVEALYPSGFTQLSNGEDHPVLVHDALYPSGFTQLSNAYTAASSS